MKRRVFKAICAVMLAGAVVVGCGKTSGGGTQGAGTPTVENAGNKEMVFASNAAGTNMDPADGYSGWACIRAGVGETLFKLSDKLEAKPFLAEEYSHSEDNLSWTIRIKEGVTFQNGKKMDAAAVKKSLERTLESNVRAQSDLNIASIEADGQTLVIKTNEPNPVLVNSLCDPYSCIIDVDSEKSVSENPIGTGPYMVESYKDGKETDVVPYAGYWGGTPKLSHIRLVSVEKDAMPMALQTGEIDAAYGMSYEGQSMFAGDENYNLQTVATSRIYFMYYNFENEHLSNANVRKALSMLADKKAYGETAMSGFGEPATGCFPEDTAYNTGVSDVEFDADKAVELLKAEGYQDSDNDGILDKKGSPLHLEYVTYSSRAELPLIAAAFQSQCKQVGIDVNVSIVESAEETLAAGKFDLAGYCMVTLPTGAPGPFLNAVMGEKGGSNFGHYNSAEVQSLLEQLNTELDGTKQAELASRIVAIALQDNAYCFEEHLKMSLVTKATVKGLVPSSCDYYQITVDTDIEKQ